MNYRLLSKSVRHVLNIAKVRSLVLAKGVPLIIHSAGPNGPESYSSIVQDAYAFYTNPRVLFSTCYMLLKTRNYVTCMSLCLILLFGLPHYLIVMLIELTLY
jgi:hypothetical protein